MNMKRMRGRNHRTGGGGGGGGPVRQHGGGVPLNRNHVFDSNGPDLRVRGTAQQLFERYLQLGRDATSVGDRVMAESYFQHAEHYFRILTAMTQAQQGPPGQNGQQPQRRPSMHDGPGDMNDGGGESDDAEPALPGLGEQPGGDLSGAEQPMLSEARHIPITAAPPEG